MNIYKVSKLVVLISTLYVSCVSGSVSASEGTLAIDKNPGELSAQLLGEIINPNGIVVMLHGCGQDGLGFAQNSGMLKASKNKNIALLSIEQSKSNNVQACFNWFSEQDNTAGKGELASIEAFMTLVEKRYPNRPTYLLGLSAGGAMASALLLQRPELFDGAAVVAGVPYPCANNLIQAISCMKSGSSISAEALAKALKASKTPWPPLMVFTGDSDSIVNAENSHQMVEQYAALIGKANLTLDKSIQHGTNKKLTETTYLLSNNQPAISLFSYEGLGHGIPIDKLDDEQTQVPFYIPSEKGVATIIMDRWF